MKTLEKRTKFKGSKNCRNGLIVSPVNLRMEINLKKRVAKPKISDKYTIFDKFII